MPIETKRLYLGKSEIETGSYAQLQEELKRLRRELFDLAEKTQLGDGQAARDVEYLLYESETR